MKKGTHSSRANLPKIRMQLSQGTCTSTISLASSPLSPSVSKAPIRRFLGVVGGATAVSPGRAAPPNATEETSASEMLSRPGDGVRIRREGVAGPGGGPATRGGGPVGRGGGPVRREPDSPKRGAGPAGFPRPMPAWLLPPRRWLTMMNKEYRRKLVEVAKREKQESGRILGTRGQGPNRTTNPTGRLCAKTSRDVARTETAS